MDHASFTGAPHRTAAAAMLQRTGSLLSTSAATTRASTHRTSPRHPSAQAAARRTPGMDSLSDSRSIGSACKLVRTPMARSARVRSTKPPRRITRLITRASASSMGPTNASRILLRIRPICFPYHVFRQNIVCATASYPQPINSLANGLCVLTNSPEFDRIFPTKNPQ